MTTLLLMAATFLVGLFVGREIDDLYYQTRALIKRGTDMTTPEKLRRRQFVLIWVLVGVLAANVFLGALLQITRIQQGDFTQCSAEYNQQFSEAYKARLQASTEATEALDRLVLAVNSKDREKFHAALANYVTLRTKAKATAQANPYPPLPDQFCGVPK